MDPLESNTSTHAMAAHIYICNVCARRRTRTMVITACEALHPIRLHLACACFSAACSPRVFCSRADSILSLAKGAPSALTIASPVLVRPRQLGLGMYGRSVAASRLLLMKGKCSAGPFLFWQEPCSVLFGLCPIGSFKS